MQIVCAYVQPPVTSATGECLESAQCVDSGTNAGPGNGRGSVSSQNRSRRENVRRSECTYVCSCEETKNSFRSGEQMNLGLYINTVGNNAWIVTLFLDGLRFQGYCDVCMSHDCDVVCKESRDLKRSTCIAVLLVCMLTVRTMVNSYRYLYDRDTWSRNESWEGRRLHGCACACVAAYLAYNCDDSVCQDCCLVCLCTQTVFFMSMFVHKYLSFIDCNVTLGFDCRFLVVVSFVLCILLWIHPLI